MREHVSPDMIPFVFLRKCNRLDLWHEYISRNKVVELDTGNKLHPVLLQMIFQIFANVCYISMEVFFFLLFATYIECITENATMPPFNDLTSTILQL